MRKCVNIKLVILLIPAILAGISEVLSQNITNKGRDFWVGYGHHQFMEPGQTNGQEMILYFSADQTANVTVTVQGRTATQVTNYVVPAGQVIPSNLMPKSGTLDCRLYDVPPTFGGNGGEGLFNVSIHIESDVPIVAYAHIFGSVSSGATMLMPVEAWGYSYMSINSQQIDAGGPGFSWVYVIAQHDNTVIRVTPSVATRLNKPAGVPFDVTLQRGQIYQFIGQSDAGGNGNQFTGSTVKSIANAQGDCYPIAVFSGSSRTKGEQIPCGSNSGRDNDMQQCFPTQAWGKRYLTAPFSSASGPSAAVTLNASTFQTSVYKVAVKDPTTVVRRNGVPLTGLINGTYYQFSSNTADYIESDKPIMIAQFMSGASGCNTGTWGDPEMVFLSPIEQAIKRVGFYRNTRQSIYANYVTIIVPTNGVPSLRIDGSATFNHTYPHPNLPGYTIVVKGWQATQAQCVVQSDSAFTAITYGLGSAESYAYNAGTFLNNLNAVASIQNTPDPATPQHPFTCVGTPIKLSALFAYQPTRIDWLISQLGADISPSTDIIDNAPVSSGTALYNGVTYFKYTLPGNYVFSRADTFYLPLNAYHPSIENCYNREGFRVPIIVKPRPEAAFTFSHSGCTLDPVSFTGATAAGTGYTANAFNWTFPVAPLTGTGQNLIRTLPPGTHAVNLSVVTTDGCSDDTTRNITIFDKPPAEFQVTPASLCEGTSFTITDTSSSLVAVTEWYWDFGNGVTQNITTGPSVTYTYPLPGTYTIKHVARSSVTCVSDTVSRVVTVYERPAVSFTNNAAGCLDVSGLVQFTGSATTSDAQTISSWAWNFGDPNATPGNPNTSNLQNPSHNYQQGTYTITLTATTSNGCTRTATQNVTFNLKPALTYTALNAVCENDAPLSVAFASVTNGVTGNGVYQGPGTNAAGQFNPATAGFGTHTIWYVFTSGAGCIDSVSQTILVHARPRTRFSLPAPGCLPVSGQVAFTNNSTIPDGQTMTWLWDFGDPFAGPGNLNTSTLQDPTHNYREGTYTIKLTATSNNGCFRDTTVTATFAVTPDLSYGALPGICVNAAPVSVATGTVLNNVTGTATYSGPGTNAAGQFDPAAAGPGLHTITYSFTSAGGCTATRTSTIEVYPQPTATFTLANGGSACLGQTVQITPTATVPSGSITQWSWNLGNGNTPVYTNGNPFNANYTSTGNFNVQLVTTSDRGCTSNPAQQAVTIRPLPVADFDVPLKICLPGSPAVFQNRSTAPDNSTLTYSWDFGDGNTSTATSPSHVYAAAGNYTVTLTATSAFGCVHQVSKQVNDFFAKPVADFSVNPQELCQGADNTFIDASTPSTGTLQSWSWTFGDGTTSTSQNPVKRYNTPGTYNVRLVVTNSGGCASDPFIIPVTVHLQPVINAGPDYVVPQGTVISLNPTANSFSLAFTWSPPTGIANPNALFTTLTAVQDQTYTLTAVGSFGCRATDQLTVKILKPVKVPNVFSPNGDNIHDRWVIPNLEDYPGCTVEVFNRYGQQVFYSAGYGTAWDGTYRGKDLPAGTYYYIIQLRNGFKPLNGSVTILR